MIALPARPAPNGVTVTQIDFGMFQRGAVGSVTKRLNRPGNRYSLDVTFPLMRSEQARVFVGRLQRGISEGIKIEFPLLGVSQGSPGLAVVDGANPEGTSLPLRGMTPGYSAKEGYWINVTDADGGVYLHNVTAAVRTDAAGDATLTIWPPIRTPLADGSTVNLSRPFAEGYIASISYGMVLGDFVQVGFTLEEDK